MLRLGFICKKHKGQLKIMDNEQNLKKNTGKGTQVKISKKCIKRNIRLTII